ncbi:MAG TPA: putative toxin-antitoxin system toxin component, PIN family [Baekduia sp.]|jgi:putative PIN family toxin of toxin-antitoxin system
MQRVVLDVNVFVAACLSPRGTVIVSPLLLAELDRVLRRPKFSRWIAPPQITALVAALEEAATLVPDPPAQPGLTADPGDDYLVALARAAGADCIVSGDAHLTDLVDPRPPVLTPRAFLDGR